MCLWGAEALCVHSYKQLAKTHLATATTPLTQLRGWLPCGGTESNWNPSPRTAQKLGNFSARWRAVRKPTPVTQGQGAQLEHSCSQSLPVVAVGRAGISKSLWHGTPRKAAICPFFTAGKRCVGRHAPFSQGISACHSAVSFVPTAWNQVDFTQRSGETDFTTLWLTLDRGEWEQQSFMTHYIV